MPIILQNQIYIADSELSESFFQSAGPGGQNVNKVATAARVSFDLGHSPSIPEELRQFLLEKLKNKVSADGIIAAVSRLHRTQLANRETALEKLTSLLENALKKPKERRPTRPGKAAIHRRLDTKKKHSMLKKSRQSGHQQE